MKDLLRLFPLISLGVLLTSCVSIPGDLELLVDEEISADNPCWSSDGSKIYYILNSETNLSDMEGVWSLEIQTGKKEQISNELRGFDVSRKDNLGVSYLDEMIRLLDIETWTYLDSFQPNDRPDYFFFLGPLFSYESSQILYYGYIASDSVFLRKFNRNDSTDEELIRKGSGYVFAPGPGDTLIAVWDTIYNLNSGERIPIGLEPRYLDWNPVVPTELLICTWDDKDIFLFDINSRKITRINSGPPQTNRTTCARFSPDGKKIVFATEDAVDGNSRIWLFTPSD